MKTNEEYVEQAYEAVDELVESVDAVSGLLAASCRISPINEAFKQLRKCQFAVRMARRTLGTQLKGMAADPDAGAGQGDTSDQWDDPPQVGHPYRLEDPPDGSPWLRDRVFYIMARDGDLVRVLLLDYLTHEYRVRNSECVWAPIDHSVLTHTEREALEDLSVDVPEPPSRVVQNVTGVEEWPRVDCPPLFFMEGVDGPGPVHWTDCICPRFRGFVWDLPNGRRLHRLRPDPICWMDQIDGLPLAVAPSKVTDPDEIYGETVAAVPVPADAVMMATKPE